MVRAKESIERLKPYINGNHSHKLIKNHKKILKLDSNEATLPLSPHVMGAIMRYLQDGPVHWYPDIESHDLRVQLATYTGVPMEYLLSFNGSDHALETVARTFLGPNDEVIYFQPTYDHFRVYAESCDALMVPVTENAKSPFLKSLEPFVSGRTKIVYLVNPNNPTGHLVAPRQILAALRRYPDILFLVDEAYFEFCNTTVAPFVLDHTNLVVTRSFSKAFGLASLRCGYVIAHPDLCRKIGKIRVGKNVNAIAQIAATAALEDLDSMRRYVEEVHTAKRWIMGKLKQRNVLVKTTPANFILIKVKEPLKILTYLESRHIYIRDRSAIPQLKGFIRLTIGDQLVMKRFWKVFKTIPSEWLLLQDKQKKSGWPFISQ